MERRQSLLPQIGFCILLAAIAALLRIFPIAWNLSAVGAVALCAGWVLRSRPWLAILVPLSAMLISDAVLGLHDWRMMLVIYAALAVPALVGRFLGSGPVAWRVGAFAAGESILFFIATNFAHWVFFNTYPHTLPGLVECYIAALPFFKFTLLGDLLFSGVFFSAAVLLQKYWQRYPMPALGGAAPVRA